MELNIPHQGNAGLKWSSFCKVPTESCCHFPLYHSVKEDVCDIIVYPIFRAALLAEHEIYFAMGVITSLITTHQRRESESESKPQSSANYFPEKSPILLVAKEQEKLSSIAQHYLGIPATQVSIERLFSSAGNTVSIRRENLHAEHVEGFVIRPRHFYNGDLFIFYYLY
ncbi:hypothetical protein PR048_032997, partial [Dryococelus australis]